MLCCPRTKPSRLLHSWMAPYTQHPRHGMFQGSNVDPAGCTMFMFQFRLDGISFSDCRDEIWLDNWHSCYFTLLCSAMFTLLCSFLFRLSRTVLLSCTFYCFVLFSWFFLLFSFFCSSPVLCSSSPLLPLFDDPLPMDVEQLLSERGLNTSKFVDLTRTELQDFEGNLIEPRIHAPSAVDTSHTFKSQRLPGRRKNRSLLGVKSVKCLVLSKVCKFGFSNFGWCFFQDSSSMLFVLDLFNAFNLWICKSWSKTIWTRSRSNHRLEEQHKKIWGKCMNLLSDYASLWFSIWGGHNLAQTCKTGSSTKIRRCNKMQHCLHGVQDTIAISQKGYP